MSGQTLDFHGVLKKNRQIGGHRHLGESIHDPSSVSRIKKGHR